MRAAIYRKFQGPIKIEDVPDPEPEPGAVVVEVLATGLCRSDYHGWRGTDPDIECPNVGGHEFCGRVVAVGEGVTRVGVGDRVVAPFVCGCGECEQCQADQHQICRSQQQPGFTRWGSFAQQTVIPNADLNAVPVPDAVSDELAALVGCRVSTAYRGVFERGQLASDEVLCVAGCGGVGLAAVAIGAAIGARVIAVDRNERALEMALEMGAENIVLVGEGEEARAEANEEVWEATGGAGAHLAVDALGSSATAWLAAHALRPLGKLVQIGLFPTPLAEFPIARVIREELQVLGVHGLSPSRLPEVLHLVELGLNLEPMLAKRISLNEVPKALPAMGEFTEPGVTIVTSF